MLPERLKKCPRAQSFLDFFSEEVPEGDEKTFQEYLDGWLQIHDSTCNYCFPEKDA